MDATHRYLFIGKIDAMAAARAGKRSARAMEMEIVQAAQGLCNVI